MFKTFNKTQSLAITGNYKYEATPCQLLATFKQKWYKLPLIYYNALMIGCIDETMKKNLTAKINALTFKPVKIQGKPQC
ncbi:hypothetical protein SAMN05660649_02122 [Desulfotomaculum arcticum]|uniref:Uncharacterized protein n=1 Tax=Desulfotruncus arcticus DSM 17038 TaxID=1121424 RepID=A0A1I2TH49_9FIRM|nr:hypothetical protein [Desulfotruncus arcticus]SFG61641.1 hypothetical protein SAMN05660649_02122 [Desulfotomaculum arcticum] [Desulfotruncus arcticus DSM 17038]